MIDGDVETRRFVAIVKNGVPLWAAGTAIMLGALAIVLIAAVRAPSAVRGYAIVHATAGGCVLDSSQRLNALNCDRLGKDVYRVSFSRSIRGSAPVVSREACCPGSASVSVDSDRSVTVVFSDSLQYPIRASIIVP